MRKQNYLEAFHTLFSYLLLVLGTMAILVHFKNKWLPLADDLEAASIAYAILVFILLVGLVGLDVFLKQKKSRK